MRAFGIDISHWQSPYKYSPVDFVIMKTSGGLMLDPAYNSIKAEVMNCPVKGAYHYQSSAVPWQAQADFFLNASAFADFIVMDVEPTYNSMTGSFVADAVKGMGYLALNAHKPVLFYCNPNAWNTYFFPFRAELMKYELWFARYWFSRLPTDPAVPANMRQDWRFWQYSDRGKGFGCSGSSVDLNVYNGTVEDLQTWIANSHWKICPTCNGSGKVPA